jgi:hypothetical protein
VYGDKDNIQTTPQTQVKILNDTSFRSYRYKAGITTTEKALCQVIFYSNEDRLFVGLSYRWRHYAWAKPPFVSNQALSVHYSLLENAFSVSYRAIFPKLVAKSDLTLYTNYDDIRWVYFFGLGNNTKFSDDKKLKYYTMRTKQWIVQPGLVRTFGKSTVSVFGSVSGIKMINDTARFLNKVYEPDKSIYSWQTFAGAGISYSFPIFE